MTNIAGDKEKFLDSFINLLLSTSHLVQRLVLEFTHYETNHYKLKDREMEVASMRSSFMFDRFTFPDLDVILQIFNIDKPEFSRALIRQAAKPRLPENADILLANTSNIPELVEHLSQLGTDPDKIAILRNALGVHRSPHPEFDHELSKEDKEGFASFINQLLDDEPGEEDQPNGKKTE